MELDQVIADLNRRYKRKVITVGSTDETRTIPTGLWNLDFDLGGGVTLGRQFGIVGHEGSGKTTLALSIAREALWRGYYVVWADCERSLDWNWVYRVGITDTSNFGVMTGLTGEDTFKTIRDVLLMAREQDDKALIVVDSIAAMVPADDFENTTTVAPGARLVNRAIRVWNALQTPNIGIVLINQYRSSPGQMRPVLPHGQGQLFHLSQRLDLREGKWLKEGDIVVGKEVRYSVRKNKTASPYGSGQLDLYFDRVGCFDHVKALAIAAIETGVVDQKGAWYKFPSGSKVQGINGLTNVLSRHDNEYNETTAAVVDCYRNKPMELVDETVEED